MVTIKTAWCPTHFRTENLRNKSGNHPVQCMAWLFKVEAQKAVQNTCTVPVSHITTYAVILPTTVLLGTNSSTKKWVRLFQVLQ